MESKNKSMNLNDDNKQQKDDKQQKDKQQKDDKQIKSKDRCSFCNKKLKLIHFTCRCNLKFCEKHHNPHSHNCQFDMKNFHKDKLFKNNPIIHQKLEKI